MANVQDDIRSRVDAFVSELSVLVRQAAFEALRASLAGEAHAPVLKAAQAAPAAARSKAARPAARSAARPAPKAAPRPAAPAARPAPKAAAPAPAAKAPAAKAPAAKAPAAKAPAAKAPAAKAPAAKAPLPATAFKQRDRAKGEKRKPEELAALVNSVHDYVKAHPETGIEAMGRALAIPTKDLSLPLKKLIAEKKVTAQGEKRATKYSAR